MLHLHHGIFIRLKRLYYECKEKLIELMKIMLKQITQSHNNKSRICSLTKGSEPTKRYRGFLRDCFIACIDVVFSVICCCCNHLFQPKRKKKIRKEYHKIGFHKKDLKWEQNEKTDKEQEGWGGIGFRIIIAVPNLINLAGLWPVLETQLW